MVERGQLGLQFGEGLFQHLAVTGVAGGLELLPQSLPGEQQSLAPAIPLLVVGRHGTVDGISALRHFLLLLFDRFALPTASHNEF